ncbi:MAG TPA: flavin reductase family protein [Thermodesulfobacteriota bacterium]|nr:flavin reductase family protein [Deltaproteobacteria bacterium]HNR12377.1 flavin reductase family protein [Thermodesulfobacteriota bacterium]HQO78148.1 flavin reductase family protein [Thermodesulfobacteriota bacterium]
MEKRKIESLSEATRLINHGPCLIISVGDKTKDNLFTVAWNMPLRKDPPLVAIETGKGHYSYDFIARTGEFAMNVPPATIIKSVVAAGTITGAAVEDKFQKVGLTREAAEHIKAPLVAEAVANLECRVCQVVDMGASALLIAQVVSARVSCGLFDENGWNFTNGLQFMHHLGGSHFAVSERKIHSGS